MEVKFDIEDFSNDKNWLLTILSSLRRKNRFKRNKESDIFFATSPALACKYIEYLVAEYDYGKEGRVYKNTHQNKFSPELEKVFSRNVKYALKYLIITNQTKFSDDAFNKRVMNKIFNNAFYSFVYARKVIKKRIPIEKESVFLKDFNSLYQYSKQIIGGRYEKSLDSHIRMLSFSEEAKLRHDYKFLESYLKSADKPKDQSNVSLYYGRFF